MIGNGERVGGRRCDGLGRVAWTAAVALLVAVPVVAVAQQPPRLNVYSDRFTSGTAAPGSAQRGTDIAVDVGALDQLEADTTGLAQRMQAHLSDSGAHQPHGHPHTHCPPGTYEASATPRPGHEDPADPSDAEQLAAAESPPSHCDLLGLLDATLEFLAPTAHAQAQPPPLQVYRDDLGGPSETAPTTPRTSLDADLSVDIPLIDTVRALIAQLDTAIRQHVAARPGHAHGHPHSGGGAGTGDGSMSGPGGPGLGPGGPGFGG